MGLGQMQRPVFVGPVRHLSQELDRITSSQKVCSTKYLILSTYLEKGPSTRLKM